MCLVVGDGHVGRPAEGEEGLGGRTAWLTAVPLTRLKSLPVTFTWTWNCWPSGAAGSMTTTLKVPSGLPTM